MEASVHDKNEVPLGKHPPAPSMLVTEALMFKHEPQRRSRLKPAYSALMNIKEIIRSRGTSRDRMKFLMFISVLEL